MVGTYRCPKCNGTEITWDRGTSKAICPKDKTPVKNYKIIPDEEES